MATVRAAVFTGDGRVELREFSRPAPVAGGALLRVEAVGLCGTDLAQFHGRLGLPGETYPVVPGHEIVGRIAAIDAVAAARWGVVEGDRVAVEEIVRCGECRGCRAFEPTCEAIGVYGITFGLTDPPGLWGGCADHMVLRPGSIVHRADPDAPAAVLALFEPLANAMHWLAEVGLVAGETVVVQGPGHQGLACMVAALAAGAGLVIATGTGQDGLRLAAARALGVHHTIDVDAEDPLARVTELTGGRLADLVLDVAAGTPTTLPLAVSLARPRGRIALAGFKHGRAAEGLVTDRVIVKKLTIRGVGGFTHDSVRAALGLIATRRAALGPLVGEVLSLERIREGIDLLARAVPGRDAVRVSLGLG
jgi:threonine dehydrogenase-like Zn-dependent dehydrogenase